MTEKKQIEKAYVDAVYNDVAPNVFANTILEIFDKQEKETRTGAQNRARWKYLSMVASMLTEQGQTYNPPGTTIEVWFTKDNLYEIYWQTTRKYMFPNKKKQLNTAEFSKLVDMVQALFAKIFEITIPFPNWKDMELNSQY
jgi:hypothetical protein